MLDVTIAYPDGNPLGLDTLALGTRQKCDISVHYKMHKAENVPFHNEDQLRDWLYLQYVHKDKILGICLTASKSLVSSFGAKC